MGFLAPFAEASGISLCRRQDIGLKEKSSLVRYASFCVQILPVNSGFCKMIDTFFSVVKETQGQHLH